MPKDRACANTPALPRRSFLAGAASSPFLAADPALSGTPASELDAYSLGVTDGMKKMTAFLEAEAKKLKSSKSPVAQKFEQWRELHAWLNSEQSNALPEPEFESLCDDLYRLEGQVLAKPSQSALDVLFKVAAQTEYGLYGADSRPNGKLCWEEFERFTA